MQTLKCIFVSISILIDSKSKPLLCNALTSYFLKLLFSRETFEILKKRNLTAKVRRTNLFRRLGSASTAPLLIWV